MTLHTGRFKTIYLLALMLMHVSCESGGSLAEDSANPAGKGFVMLSLSSDIEIKSTEAKSDVADYYFRYVGVGDYATSDYYRYGDVSWPMEWYFGIFRLQAESCSVQQSDEGYGCLRYEGTSTPFSVINGQTATASVVCSVANVYVNVAFDDKMYMSFQNFKLVVESVLAPVYESDEDGNPVLVRDETPIRELVFDAVQKSGYYSLRPEDMNLRYTLYVMMDGADEFVEYGTGYFVDSKTSQPAVLKRGDYITLNVKYVGDVMVTEGVKFIVNGERKNTSVNMTVGDYVQDSVTEDN